jgi:Ca2+-binding RTX toxin-like protein
MTGRVEVIRVSFRRPATGGAGLLLGLVAALFFAAPAAASTLNSSGSAIVYMANTGEVNALTISRSGDSFVFTDAPGVTITPTAPCTATGNAGICPAAGIRELDANLGDQNDTGTVDASVTGLRFAGTVGGVGNDTLTGGPNVPNELDGDNATPAGNDILTGGGKDDFFFGDGGNDTISGGGGDDSIEPGDGDDVADGGPGFDQLIEGFDPDGADVLNGGPDVDSLTLSFRRADTAVSLDGLANDGAGCPGAGCEGDNVEPDVENVQTGDGNDVISGSASLNTLDGGNGNDTISGGGAYDELNGADGNDALSGGAGNDELDGESGADTMSGGKGDDYAVTAFSDHEQDVISGGPGIDSIGVLIEVALPIRIDLDNRADDGFNTPLVSGPRDNIRSDVENLDGGPGPDVLVGSAAANDLRGGAGNDRLVGGKGGDSLFGDRGADRLMPGKGRDTVFGDAGADVISARDRKPDEVLCGSSMDRVKADRADRAGPDCERVRRR